MKKKIAVVCANVGEFDPVFNLPDQSIDCDFFYYTEKNLPYPLPNLNDRLKSKYVKIQMHRFLPKYDYYVWIDSSVQVTSSKFIQHIKNLLECEDVVISLHPDRDNVYSEMEYILASIDGGKEYLVKRYANEPLEEELTFYKNTGLPDDVPLFATRFFARKNSKKVNEAFNDWWNRTLEFVNFDQAMFSLIMWQHGLEVNSLNYPDTVNLFMKVHKHS